MRFGRRQIGEAGGNAGKEAELFDGVADTGVGVGDRYFFPFNCR